MFRLTLAAALFAMLLAPPLSVAAESKVDEKKLADIAAKAAEYLKTQGQASDGSYSGYAGPSITALVTTGLLRNGYSPDEPFVKKGIDYVKKYVQEDGGIYREGSTHRNYETSIAVLMFAEANQDGRFDKTLKGADAYLKGLQWDGDEGKDESDPSYGGAGYGSKKRPDLSNTSFFIDALRAAGNDEDSEAIQKALIFVSRCQNLETKHNTTEFAAKNPDGGFYYTPAAGGSSQAGETPDGGLRSYASMTYAGLKSMIYAGVDKDDPRVKAAFDWAKKHYDIESNPGMGNAGLYYYYHTFAKALNAMGVDTVVDADGKSHDWRAELVNELAERQRENGAFVNENERWLEGEPNLVTGYALLVLSYCKPSK